MVWCWWCCHSFENLPLQLPYKYDDKTNRFSTCGNFCSWSCMKSYNMEKYGLSRGAIIMGNMIIMRKKLYNVVDNIRSAPPRVLLKEFGGTLTIEEFRNNETSDKMLTQNKVDQSYQHQPEFVKRVSMPQSTKLSDISCSSGTNEPLRLKRSKPLKRDENNLEKSLGITRKKTTP